MSARLEAALPGPRLTLFLRACLLEPEPAAAAWRRWLAGGGDPVTAFADPEQACRRLAPLLAGTATGNDRLGAAVSASVLREELRWNALAAAAAEVLDTLGAAGVDAVVTGGVAAAVCVYAQPCQRHCHDVDLVVGSARAQAGVVLTQAGLRRVGPWSFAHESGTLVSLHAAPARSRAHRLPVDDVRARAVPARLGQAHVAVVAPEHLLLRACEGAFVHAGRGSLGWAADAAMVVRSLSRDRWPDVVTAATTSRMVVPAAVGLGYLNDRVGVPVPAESLAVLRAEAARAGARAERACLALVPRTSAARRLARRARARFGHLATRSA